MCDAATEQARAEAERVEQGLAPRLKDAAMLTVLYRLIRDDYERQRIVTRSSS